MKTYADYLKQGNRATPQHLMPLTARPKTSNGDYPKERARRAYLKDLAAQNRLNGKIEVKDLTIKNNNVELKG